ncbi:gp303 [Bacillus phage G]|uniref:Gp303 n=1 Tax=Bacillus phage G TaxID=2884420 RepID=G3MA44_9CAUD|nr:gp303 [Bacillus phage G]AEO93562.1 gp303 [Bacillus phage G]
MSIEEQLKDYLESLNIYCSMYGHDTMIRSENLGPIGERRDLLFRERNNYLVYGILLYLYKQKVEGVSQFLIVIHINNSNFQFNGHDLRKKLLKNKIVYKKSNFGGFQNYDIRFDTLEELITVIECFDFLNFQKGINYK